VYYADLLHPSPLAETATAVVQALVGTPPESSVAASAVESSDRAANLARIARAMTPAQAGAQADSSRPQARRALLPGPLRAFLLRLMVHFFLRDADAYFFGGYAGPIRQRLLDLLAASDGPAIVIGHSLGGAVALELCGRHPDLAAGLVMIDTIVLPSPDAASSPEIEGLLAGVGGPDYRAVVREMAWSIGFDYDHPARRQALFDTFILGPCLRTPQHVAYSALRNMIRHHDPVPAARACRIPMAYISADVPLVEAARDLDLLRELCPQLVTAKTLLAGHFNTIEVAEQVNAMIERFLAVGLRSRGR
jgi:pimeloyl-ACP methyl ester carboxylesterase